MAKDMTTGSPAKQILLFSIPLLIGNLFQQFYNMADAFIVGRTLGSDALAAVGCTNGINFLILGLATGSTAGMAIETAQRFGAQDYEGVKRSFAVSTLISILLTIILTVLGILATKPLLRLLHTPADIFDDAYRYFIVIMAGTVSCLLFNLMSNIMRAVGDSISPLIFLIIACVLNIILDYAFILGLGMGTEGAGIATVLAQFLSGLLCVFYVKRKVPVLQINRTHFRCTAAEWRRHLHLGLPMGFQSSIIAIGIVVVQFALNTLGTTEIAAYTAAMKLDNFGVLPLMSFGIAMATYVGQNHGANKLHRIRQGIFQCSIISVTFALVIGAIDILWGDVLSAIFLSGDTAAIKLSHECLIINGACYSLLALLFIFRYSLQGLGHSFVPTVAGIAELIMRSVCAIALTSVIGYTGTCIANPLAWIGSLIPLSLALIPILRRMPKYAPDEEIA
ncbi:MAG: MATE family efflux transporter [Anaerotignum sp.]|nr:MATE family efflux transporter [Anaerotignum sp.]